MTLVRSATKDERRTGRPEELQCFDCTGLMVQFKRLLLNFNEKKFKFKINGNIFCPFKKTLWIDRTAFNYRPKMATWNRVNSQQKNTQTHFIIFLKLCYSPSLSVCYGNFADSVVWSCGLCFAPPLSVRRTRKTQATT